ncbi:hypothetical protein NVP1244A_191 [Vibrio phage 1.244.A._10N.261.54.C3]|nr:hypothetical protein NVP1244A_191 [Vibrio phage 1.244.A._10N.261.54.C3]AUR98819.1 hypothetical protein NVP1255O_191 [Vibrio phage 1.255.O._10N.286.45.F1]
MSGKRYFGASEEKIDKVKRVSSETHRGTVPVRLSDGTVIKINTDDPRYLNGELKCIIGDVKGQKGPTSDPEVKARYHQTLNDRKQRFANMSSDEIINHCLSYQESGKILVKPNGNLNSNYSRLFNHAGLDWKMYLEVNNGKVQRLSKAKTATRRLF